MGRKPLFRAYVRNYEPRAVFPHVEVQYNIALCIHELQSEERLARHRALQKEFKGGPCIGLQVRTGSSAAGVRLACDRMYRIG